MDLQPTGEYIKKFLEIDYLGSYKDGSGSYLFFVAKQIAHARLAGKDINSIKAEAQFIAKHHAETMPMTDKEKSWHLLRIAVRFAALGELLDLDLLPLVRPLLLDGLKEFGEGKPEYYILGPDFPESSGARVIAFELYETISHYALVDISAKFAIWRAAVVRHLKEGRDWEHRQKEIDEELVKLDSMIANYKPLPGSTPL